MGTGSAQVLSAEKYHWDVAIEKGDWPSKIRDFWLTHQAGEDTGYFQRFHLAHLRGEFEMTSYYDPGDYWTIAFTDVHNVLWCSKYNQHHGGPYEEVKLTVRLDAVGKKAHFKFSEGPNRSLMGFRRSFAETWGTEKDFALDLIQYGGSTGNASNRSDLLLK